MCSRNSSGPGSEIVGLLNKDLVGVQPSLRTGEIKYIPVQPNRLIVVHGVDFRYFSHSWHKFRKAAGRLLNSGGSRLRTRSSEGAEIQLLT